MTRGDKVGRAQPGKPLNEQASGTNVREHKPREHEKHSSGQRPDLSKHHSYNRQVGFKRFSEITEQVQPDLQQ